MAKAQPEDLTPVAPGEILADKYRVERVIGVGGMGVVVAATHVELEEPRALKFMLRKYSDDAEAAARFVREAKAAARLKSEHVGAIYDIGRLESGQPYMVMEYLAGDDLRVILEREGQLPIEQAVDYTLQALCGLAEAHAAGIVHRDLKPANLFVTQGSDGLPRVKIVDFGISKLTGATAQPTAAKTQTAALLGSPHYMSPEQLACARLVDARTDIWSVGIMLYEMLTGKLPFDGPSVTAVTVVVVQKDPPKPSGLRPEIAPALEAAILRCLAKDPGDRFPDVAALGEALAPFGSDAGRNLVEHVKRVQQAARPSADEGDAGSADGRVVGTESVWEHATGRRPRSASGGVSPPGQATCWPLRWRLPPVRWSCSEAALGRPHLLSTRAASRSPDRRSSCRPRPRAAGRRPMPGRVHPCSQRPGARLPSRATPRAQIRPMPPPKSRPMPRLRPTPAGPDTVTARSPRTSTKARIARPSPSASARRSARSGCRRICELPVGRRAAAHPSYAGWQRELLGSQNHGDVGGGGQE